MNKFERAQELIKKLNVDGWLTISDEGSDVHSHFLLGVNAPSLNYIYIAANGDHRVLAVQMEAPMIERSLKNKGIKAKVDSFSSLKDLESKLTTFINKPRIALNFGENQFNEKSTYFADHLTVGNYFSIKHLAPNTEFISSAPIIYGLRSVKNQEELKDLRNVCKATLEILETLPDIVKKGMSENEVKAEIEYKYMKLGKPSFPAIVGTGAHSADPHHNTSNKKIDEGVLLIDTGLQIDQMCSDITWTVWVGKKPSDEFINAYSALYESKEIANEYFIDDSPANLPSLKCRAYLEEKGYDHEKLFFHGLGHSLGFEAHDIGPRVSWKVSKESKLRENMVYTNEPGLYWKGKWGVRLEDDIIIGKDKCEKVTYNHEDPIII
ncbi:MAG: aminopeptidase P family protein [Candidatus Lokiarchaeota archaeon]|nr:aminopeptidase P family protein [Candidatus Lokiarchaeota archaeon]